MTTSTPAQTPVPTAPRRLTRQEQQAATRERLLTAAATAFATHGFHGTSVAAVADTAGYTTGAVYSNFASKEELFLALLDRHIGEQVQGLTRALLGTGDLGDLVDRVSEWFRQLITVAPEWTLLLIEFGVHVRRSKELSRQLRDRHRAARAALGLVLDAEAGRFGVDLPAASEVLASAIFGLGNGLVVQHLLDPGSGAAEVFHHSLYALLALEPPDAPPQEEKP